MELSQSQAKKGPSHADEPSFFRKPELFTDTQFSDDCTITFDIFFSQIVQQATTGMMIFLVLL